MFLKKECIVIIITMIISIFVKHYILNNKLKHNLLKKVDNESKNTTIHQSNLFTIINYLPSGKINYKLQANKVEISINKEITNFINFQAIIFDDMNNQSWEIKSNTATLIKDKILYLYGNVNFNNLNYSSSYVRKIITNSASLNLISKNLISNDKVILLGNNFKITSMKIYVNFKKQIIELFEKVNTVYEIYKNP